MGLNSSNVFLRKGLVNSPLMNRDVPCGDCVLKIIALLSNKNPSICKIQYFDLGY